MNCILPGVPSGVALWSSELNTKNELSDFLATETVNMWIDIIQFRVTTVLSNVPQANVNFSRLQQTINYIIEFKTIKHITIIGRRPR